jgi:hypothetical protein
MQPTWSPDGTQLALTESDGVHVFSNIPDLRAADPSCAQISERALGYGSEPAWGPADVAAGSTGSDGSRPAPMTRLNVPKRQNGQSVRVRVRIRIAGSTVRVRLFSRARRRLVGNTARRAARTGTLWLKAPLNRRGRVALRRRHRLRLTVRVAVTPPGGSPTIATRQMTLKR